MKGGKDEEKVMSPLFPRLHINDAEKGGPKAPPRNKMALYEQLSIPTQRFTSGSSNVFPIPHERTGNLVPSASSSHHKTSPYASHLASVGAVLNTSSKHRAGQLKTTSERDSCKLSIASHCSYFQPHNFSSSKNTLAKRRRDEDHFKVPAFLQLENTPKRDYFVRISGHHRSTSDLFSKHHTSNGKNTQKPISNSGNEDEVLEKQEEESCFKPSARTDDQSHCSELQIVEVEKDAEITKTCDVDSVSGVSISPDAVVEAVGQKQFWKTRRAMIHQQKVFAVQLFELHRLIEVQKLFAESPDILMEDKVFLGKSSNDKLPDKKLLLENAPEPPPKTAQPREDPQIPNLITDPNKGLANLFSNYKPYSGPVPDTTKPSPWCLPPGNQWLVPMMSPSEGLIYKPITGPLPLPGPIQSGPMGLAAPTREDYLSFGFFPPYANSFSSFCMKNLVESKESEINASTASSPDYKFHENALPLFPTAPTARAFDKSEKTQNSMNCNRVIKVVPHNARLASESAARIFRSITEERRQHDH